MPSSFSLLLDLLVDQRRTHEARADHIGAASDNWQEPLKRCSPYATSADKTVSTRAAPEGPDNSVAHAAPANTLKTDTATAADQCDHIFLRLDGLDRHRLHR
jgi:hypothetical protein